MNITKTVTAVAAIAATSTALTACGSKSTSADTSHPTMKQRITSAKACIPLAKPLASAAPVAKGLVSKKIAPADAVKQLAPLQAALTKAAADTKTPAGAAASKLATDIAGLQKNTPKDPAAIKTAGTTLVTDLGALTKACLG